MKKKEKKGMKKSEMAKPMKNNFVSFNLKDNQQVGQVKMMSPKCANSGSY